MVLLEKVLQWLKQASVPKGAGWMESMITFGNDEFIGGLAVLGQLVIEVERIKGGVNGDAE